MYVTVVLFKVYMNCKYLFPSLGVFYTLFIYLITNIHIYLYQLLIPIEQALLRSRLDGIVCQISEKLLLFISFF